MAEDVDGTEFDRELLARVRAGEDAAYGELFSRHADAVRRFSLRHVREPAEADDLTAEAFFRVLQAIRRGTGPTDHVRTYLLTVARRVAWEWSGRRRDVPVDDEELSRRVEPYADATAQRAEYSLIGRAFKSLPERWRTVLWQVEVEGERPSAVAPHYGLSANAMSALARRAREGLRAAYLQAHLADGTGTESCGSVVSKLGSYTAGGVQGAEQRRIRKHLRTCARCNALHAELTEVCSTLRAHAAFLAVPVAATALVGAKYVTSIAVTGKAALLSSRIKLVFAAAATAAAVGLFGLVAGMFTGTPGPALIQADQNAPHDDRLTLVTTISTTIVGTGIKTDQPSTGEQPQHRDDEQPPAPTPSPQLNRTNAATEPPVAPVVETGTPLAVEPKKAENTVPTVAQGMVKDVPTSTTTTPSATKFIGSASSSTTSTPSSTTVTIRPTPLPSFPTYPSYYRAE
jgi:RNA polymerase sigma factor (sigma-70 family)